MGRPTNLKLGTQMEHEDPYYQQVPWSPKLKVKVTWCVWQVLADKLRTNRPRNTKIGSKVAHPIGNNAHQFHGQRSRSPVWLMLRLEVRRIFWTERHTKLKLDTRLWRLIATTSASTSKVNGQGRKVTWCVCQVYKSRTKRPRNTKIGRKVA